MTQATVLRRSRAVLLASACAVLPGCASRSSRAVVGEVVLTGDLPAAANAALAAAPACGLRLVDARRDEGGTTAILVFLEGGPDPKAESALVTLRLVAAPDGVSCAIEGHPLAEYGMRPPDIRAGSEGLVCAPCALARADVPMLRYSRGLAMANVARATGCLGDSLRGEAEGR
jgi:hypothetical protein